MALALVQSTSFGGGLGATATNGVTTRLVSTKSTTVGNLLIAVIHFSRSTSVYDTSCLQVGWVRVASVWQTNQQTDMWYKIDTGNGSSPQFRLDATSNVNYTSVIAEFSGMVAPKLDISGSGSNSGQLTIVNTTVGTTLTDTELVVSAVGLAMTFTTSYTANATAAGGSATFQSNFASDGGTAAETGRWLDVGWATSGTAGTTPTVTHTASPASTDQNMRGIIATFTPGVAVSTNSKVRSIRPYQFAPGLAR